MFENTFDKEKFFNDLKCDLEKIGNLHILKFIISKYGGITSKFFISNEKILIFLASIPFIPYDFIFPHLHILKYVLKYFSIINWLKNSKGLSYCVQIIIDDKIIKDKEKIITDLLTELELKKEELKKEIETYNFEEEVALLLSKKLEGELQIYIEATISNIKEKGNDIKDKIKNNKSVFLVGAGLSYGSIPLTNELNALLKEISANNYEDLQDNQNNNEKSQKFKERFKEICDKASPGISHKLIALNFPEYIKEIICLNWDDLIEKAFNKCNKEIEKINRDGIEVKVKKIEEGGYLWKFHGDVKDPDYDWIFPNHEGRVFKNFENYLKNNQFLQNCQFIFVIVGYSEREKNIVKNVIEKLENRAGDIVRINLESSKIDEIVKIELGLELKHLHEENYIFGPADFVLEHILPINSNLF
jgi:hypothetical protein